MMERSIEALTTVARIISSVAEDSKRDQIGFILQNLSFVGASVGSKEMGRRSLFRLSS